MFRKYVASFPHMYRLQLINQWQPASPLSHKTQAIALIARRVKAARRPCSAAFSSYKCGERLLGTQESLLLFYFFQHISSYFKFLRVTCRCVRANEPFAVYETCGFTAYFLHKQICSGKQSVLIWAAININNSVRNSFLIAVFLWNIGFYIDAR